MANEESTQNPFTRPGFIAAAIVVALLVVLGLVIAIVNSTRADSSPDPTPSSTTAPTLSTSETAPTDAAASICGLKDDVDAKPPVSPPKAVWEYQGTTAYPTADTYGPGKDDPAGFRYCFQHSPTGALFAAANAAVLGSDTNVAGAWLEYFLAPGPHRQDLLDQGSSKDPGAGVRINVEGFRVLSYTGDAAQVDVAVRGIADGKTVNLSMVYTLVWADGDWKLDVRDPNVPIDVASIPDLTGYIPWGE